MTLRFRCLPEETTAQILKAVYDGLLEIDEGDKCFFVPKDKAPTLPDKDMYCYTCHSAGELLPCKKCWRVYHDKSNCWDGDFQTQTCKECQISSDESEKRIRGRIPTRDEMQKMLSEVMRAIQAKCPEIRDMYKTCSEEDRQMWANVLHRPEMDFSTIQENVQLKNYKRFLEFYQDFRLLVHNISLIFGLRSLLGNKVITALKIVMQQENSIRECIDCYLNWSKRNEVAEWFSIPCNQPHPVKLIRTASGSYLPGKIFLEEQEFTSVKLFGPDNKMQIVENQQIKPTVQLLSPHNPDEKIAYQQFKKYVDNLKSMCLPVPTLKPSNKNIMDDIRRKSVHIPSGTSKKVPEFLMLKSGVKAYPKMEVVSNSEDEEEQKFSLRRGSNSEWVRRSSRRRQPVKRYLDEIVSEQELTRDQMKKIKQEIVGEADDSSVHNQIRRNGGLRLKIERTGEDLVSRSRESLETHRVMEVESESLYQSAHFHSMQDSYRNNIEDLRRQLDGHDQEVMRMKHDFEKQLADAKRRQFCTVCLDRATMYCCFDHSYCSTQCQGKDWRAGHCKVCKTVANVDKKQQSAVVNAQKDTVARVEKTKSPRK